MASFLAGPLPAQDSAEVAAVEAAALDYIEGSYTADAERMERALHPHLAKRFVEDLPAGIREGLERRAAGPANETYSIGMRLARARGFSQVHPIDDRTADRVYDLEAAADGLRDHLVEHPGYERVQEYVREDRRRVREAIEAGDLLPYYRWRNSPETVERDVRLQWGIFLELADRTPVAQKRMAHWEIRNLKMVRRIREMALHHPGGRVVVVVGAGHKAFFDDYLDRMLDVDVVQVAEVLEAGGAGRDRATGARSAGRALHGEDSEPRVRP